MLECLSGTLGGSDYAAGDCPATVDADTEHLPQVMQAVMAAAALQRPGAVMVTWHPGSRLGVRIIDSATTVAAPAPSPGPPVPIMLPEAGTALLLSGTLRVNPLGLSAGAQGLGILAALDNTGSVGPPLFPGGTTYLRFANPSRFRLFLLNGRMVIVKGTLEADLFDDRPLVTVTDIRPVGRGALTRVFGTDLDLIRRFERGEDPPRVTMTGFIVSVPDDPGGMGSTRLLRSNVGDLRLLPNNALAVQALNRFADTGVPIRVTGAAQGGAMLVDFVWPPGS